MTFAQELEYKIRATYPAIYVTAREDWRCIQEVERVAKQLKQKSHVWSVTKGWDGSGKQTDPLEAVRFPAGGAAGVWILTNFHFHLDNAEVVQAVKDSIQLNKAQGRVFVFVSNVWKVPAELQDDVTRMEFGLPDRELLLERLDYVLDSVGIPDVTTKANRTREEIVEAALGMTTAEAENSFTLSLVEQRDVLPEVILREKAKAVAKSGILEFYQPGVGMEDVGGLDLLKAWLSERQSAFSSDARKYGLPEPKGILLIGPPGTGKSLVAKAVSAKWNFPLLRFDIGKVFQGLVGASEERTREALATASAVAPCIIWTDEIEKGLAGSGSNGATDSGVSARVFGTILSYMQERQRPVFWVATANQVQNLPPELLRAGRFDEIFSLDLPSSRARAEILSIHLARRRRAPAAFDLALVVQGTAQFSGAELEAVVVKALFRAFAAKREVTTEDLVAAAVVTIPLAVTRREDIQALRDWAKTRAVPASSEEWEQLAEPGKQRRIIVT